MTVTINGSTGITTPEVNVDNTAADGGQVVLKSSGYSNWNLDNYSGRIRAYYGSTEYFTINSSGNVGIGTSSPTQKLSVNGSAHLLGGGAGFPTTGVGLEIVPAGDGGINYLQAYNRNNSTWQTLNIGGSTITLNTGGSERSRIDSSGRLLVGTTTSIANGILAVKNSGAEACSFQGGSNNYIVTFHNTSGTLIGSITGSTGSTTSYNTSSDYRLKENIQPITDALTKVAALKPVTYTWKADGSDGQGFIAHELAEVCPDAVSGEKDAVNEDGSIKAQGIDTSFLVATLTAAIQEQQAIIESLKTRIEALENK